LTLVLHSSRQFLCIRCNNPSLGIW